MLSKDLLCRIPKNAPNPLKSEPPSGIQRKMMHWPHHHSRYSRRSRKPFPWLAAPHLPVFDGCNICPPHVPHDLTCTGMPGARTHLYHRQCPLVLRRAIPWLNRQVGSSVVPRRLQGRSNSKQSVAAIGSHRAHIVPFETSIFSTPREQRKRDVPFVSGVHWYT